MYIGDQLSRMLHTASEYAILGKTFQCFVFVCFYSSYNLFFQLILQVLSTLLLLGFDSQALYGMVCCILSPRPWHPSSGASQPLDHPQNQCLCTLIFVSISAMYLFPSIHRSEFCYLLPFSHGLHDSQYKAHGDTCTNSMVYILFVIPCRDSNSRP